MKPESGKWYDVPGFPNIVLTPEGRVGRRLKSGIVRELTPIVKEKCVGSRYTYVHIANKDGKRVNAKISLLVWRTLIGKTDGLALIHRDGNFRNNDIDNLVPIGRCELGKRFGANSKRKSCVRIGKDGEILDMYSSARAAARELPMSYQTVIDRCNGKVKDEFALDGTTFRWADDWARVEKLCAILKDSAIRKVGDARPPESWEW